MRKNNSMRHLISIFILCYTVLATAQTTISIHRTSASQVTTPATTVDRICCSNSDWQKIETSRGVYSWTGLDGYVTYGAAHPGTILMYSDRYVPTWASGTDNHSAPSDLHSSASCQGTLSGTTTTNCQYKEFVTSLMRHTCGVSSQPSLPLNGKCTIKIHESWNEMNVGNYWTGNVTDMAKMAEDKAAIVRAYCGDCTILGGSVSAGGDGTGGSWINGTVGLEPFLAAWAAISGAHKPDAVSWHAYPARTTIKPAPFPETLAAHGSVTCTGSSNSSCRTAIKDQVATLYSTSILRNSAISSWASNLPAWQTEGGFGLNAAVTDGIDDTDSNTWLLRRAYTARWLIALAAAPSSGVSPVHNVWYSWQDQCWGTLYGTNNNSSCTSDSAIPSGVTDAQKALSQVKTWLDSSTGVGPLTSTAVTGGNRWTVNLTYKGNGAQLAWFDGWLATSSYTTSYNTSQALLGTTNTLTGSVTLSNEPVLLTTSNTPIQLFHTKFGGTTAITSPPSYCGSTYCFQPITGTDSTTGYSWPAVVNGSNTQSYGGSPIFTQTYGSNAYLKQPASIQTVTGPDGSSTTAMFLQNICGADTVAYTGATCNGTTYTWGDGPMIYITPDTTMTPSDVYESYWVKLQPDLSTVMVSGQAPDGQWQDWRTFAEWKTGGSQKNGVWNECITGKMIGGDLRISVNIIKNSNGTLSWRSSMDTNANGDLPLTTFWTQNNTTVSVPVGTWFHFERFTHPSADNTGRFWAKVNDQLISDYTGWTINTPTNGGGFSCKINRLVSFEVYTNASANLGANPKGAYEWVTDYSIWNGVPSTSTYTLTATTPTNGTITGASSGTFNDGTNFTLRAVPNEGYAVDHWTTTGTASACNNSTNSICSFTLTGNATVAVSFVALQTFGLTVTKAGSGLGNITGTNCTIGSAAFLGGTAITCHGSASSTGSVFAGFTGTGSAVGCLTTADCSFTLNQASSVTATFALSMYTVGLTKGAYGTVTPSTTQGISYGGTVSFTIVPNLNYRGSVSGCGGPGLSGFGSSIVYTTGAVTNNCTVTVTFSKDACRKGGSVKTGGRIKGC